MEVCMLFTRLVAEHGERSRQAGWSACPAARMHRGSDPGVLGAVMDCCVKQDLIRNSRVRPVVWGGSG